MQISPQKHGKSPLRDSRFQNFPGVEYPRTPPTKAYAFGVRYMPPKKLYSGYATACIKIRAVATSCRGASKDKAVRSVTNKN